MSEQKKFSVWWKFMFCMSQSNMKSRHNLTIFLDKFSTQFDQEDS